MNKTFEPRATLRRLGWLAWAAFAAKGLVTTSLIVWGLIHAGP